MGLSSPESSTMAEHEMLDLNAHCGGGGGSGRGGGHPNPNAWEDPSLTGMRRLPPHSRNVRRMAEAYHLEHRAEGGGEMYSAGPHPPCVCLDSPENQASSSPDVVPAYANIRVGGASGSIVDGLKSERGWQFRLFPDPLSVPRSYILPIAHDDLEFCDKRTRVPSCWPMQSHTECCCGVHDPPRYTNVQMPFDVLYPHVPEDNPTGVYRLEFSALPKSWLECEVDGTCVRRRVVLHLGGVESCFFVYMNGEFAGMGKDSRLPSEFDVTSLVHRCSDGGDVAATAEKSNVLAIVVLKWSDGSFLEQQDHWRGMAGIHRSVYLYSTPADAYVEDVFCRAEIANLREQLDSRTFPPRYRGRLAIQARIGRDHLARVKGRNIYYNEQIEYALGDVAYRLLFQVYDAKGRPLFDEPIDPSYEGNDLVSDAHLRFNLVSFTLDVPGNVLAWSDECPNLYRLRATLVRMDPSSASFASEVDVFSCSIGFRNVETRDRKLLVNGQPVLIKGVNRHDHSPTRGKAVSYEETLKDLSMMKAYNFNAVRTAHYPNDPFLYEVADRLGLFVIDEANIECHGHYDMVCREPSFASAMLDRVQRMVIRDQNHPCIIGWSLGNEAGYDANHKMCYGWIKGYDGSRPVQYEGANRPVWGQLPHVYDRADSAQGSDCVCPMYPSIKEMLEWVNDIAPRINETRPFIMCEYAHAMGNSSGGLSDYWKVIKEHRERGLQGGFIWDWIDQGLVVDHDESDDNQVSRKYGGDFGDDPHDANFNINGMIGPDRDPHPAMEEFKRVAQPVDFYWNRSGKSGKGGFTLTVFNTRYFTTLDDLSGIWKINVGGFTKREGKFAFPEKLLPQAVGDVPMTGVASFFESGLEAWDGAEVHLHVDALTKDGTSVAAEQFSISACVLQETASSAAMPSYLKNVLTLPLGKGVTVNATEDNVKMSSSGFHVKIDLSSVGFEYFRDGSEKPLVWDVLPNLFRAATDNDGVKQLGKQADDDSKPLGRWLRLGLDCLSLEDVKTSPVSQRSRGYPTVTTTASIRGCPGNNRYSGIALAENVASSIQGKDSRVKLGTWRQRVTMFDNGCVYVEIKMNVDEALKDLPRVGIQASLPGALKSKCFFADGPSENYSDRRLAARAGVFRQNVPEYPSTYVVPQEQGNRMNMRWLFLGESEGDESEPTEGHQSTPEEDVNSVLAGKKGILLVSSGEKLPQFTVSRCTDCQIFAARHACAQELNPSIDMVYVRLDAAQRGLGTGSCGPQTLPEYHVNGGAHEVNFWLKPVGFSS